MTTAAVVAAVAVPGRGNFDPARVLATHDGQRQRPARLYQPHRVERGLSRWSKK